MAMKPCINCGQPLPAGAAFCGNCGARQTPANQGAPIQQAPPPTPVASDYAPTQLQPPPPPPTLDPTLRASAPPDQGAPGAYDAPPPPPGGYSQYQYNGPGSGPGTPGSSPAYPQMFDQQTQLSVPPPGYAAGPPPPPGYVPGAPSTPPGYAPGPPPVMGPGGLAPWAQPQKGSGRRVMLGLIVVVVLVVALLGGGVVLALNLLKGHSTSSAGQQSGNTPGAGNTASPGNTPEATSTATTSATGAQTLSNLNLQAIYAGVTVTITSAVQAPNDPEYQINDPSQDVLKIQAKLDNSTDSHGVDVTANTTVVGANGTPYDVATTNLADSLPIEVNAQTSSTGYWFFRVPHGAHIGDWKLVIGADNEVKETIPLNGVGYDSTMWNETPKAIGKSVTYYDGAIVGTVVKVATGVWTPGYQAPQGMRFILVDLMVMNTLATDVYVGDPEFVLLGPDGSRYAQDSAHGYDINVDLGAHASMDVGYACFVVPPAQGDFQMIFFNKDNGVAGMIDLGTL
jgi:hypothetical protein